MNIKFTKAFQAKGTIENNLKPGGRIYKFNAECYRDTGKAILVWRDIWLPKSEIKNSLGRSSDRLCKCEFVCSKVVDKKESESCQVGV